MKDGPAKPDADYQVAGKRIEFNYQASDSDRYYSEFNNKIHEFYKVFTDNVTDFLLQVTQVEFTRTDVAMNH